MPRYTYRITHISIHISLFPCVFLYSPPSSPLATVESKTSLELVDVSPLQTSPQASLLGLREKQSEEKVEENSYQLSREETKSLLLCLLFVLKYTDQGRHTVDLNSL